MQIKLSKIIKTVLLKNINKKVANWVWKKLINLKRKIHISKIKKTSFAK